MISAQLSPHLTGDELFVVVLDKNLSAFLAIDAMVVYMIIGLVVLFFLIRLSGIRLGKWRQFEIDQAQFGLGDQKLILRPNEIDQQIAYRIWVELSTRKIGLPINLDDDVISEIYDSWYDFFSVTRELVKDMPVSKFRRKDTKKIINLSIEVLNTGLRPHLTKWQARFRCWYTKALDQDEYSDASPQEVQKLFPDYETLKGDLETVNQWLIRYRGKMYELLNHH